MPSVRERAVCGQLQLFLSSRTVEYHLGKVFAKLSVASRVELARLPLEPAFAVQSA